MQETTVLFICSRCVTVFGFFCDRGTKGEESTSSSLNDGVSLSLSLSLRDSRLIELRDLPGRCKDHSKSRSD